MPERRRLDDILASLDAVGPVLIDASPESAPGGIPAAPAGALTPALPEAGRVKRFAVAAGAAFNPLDALLGVIKSTPPVLIGSGIVESVRDVASLARGGGLRARPSVADTAESLVGVPVRDIVTRMGEGDIVGGAGQLLGSAAPQVALAVVGSQALGKARATSPAAAVAPEAATPRAGGFERAMDAVRKVESVRLPLLISQPATAVRNALAQGIGYTANIFDDAAAGVLNLARGVPPSRAFARAVEDLNAAWHGVTKSGRAARGSLLERAPEAAAKIADTPTSELSAGGKFLQAMTAMNRVQEQGWRRTVFDAGVRGRLREKGLTPESASPDVLQAVAGEAADDALRLTFAKNPEAGTLMASVMKAYDAAPILRTVVPFPRFIGNSLSWLYSHSPAALLKPSVYRAVAKGDMKPLAQAATGTAFLGSAVLLRSKKDAPQRWYEIEVGGGRRLDARGFQPFAGYLFLAEAMLDSRREKPQLRGADWLSGLGLLGRLEGNPLGVVDAMVSARGNLGQAKRAAQSFAGSYLGSFLTPLAAVKDVTGQFVESERKFRDTSEMPFTGALLRNIPFGQSTIGFPPVEAVTRPGDLKKESPAVSQLTGLIMRKPTPTERELERLRVPMSSIRPNRRGDETGAVTSIMGEELPDELAGVIGNPRYSQLSDSEKRAVLLDVIRSIRSGARRQSLAR